MAVKVNPPPQLRIPRSMLGDPESRAYFEQINTILFQLYNRTGGNEDSVSDGEQALTSTGSRVSRNAARIYSLETQGPDADVNNQKINKNSARIRKLELEENIDVNSAKIQKNSARILSLENNTMQELEKTAFGALHTESRSPIVQLTAIYGVKSKIDEFAALGGTTIIEDSLFKATTGLNAGSLASMTSHKSISYRAGQGLVADFTAMFGTPAIGNQQLAGLITETDGLAFVYSVGQVFGIAHIHGGEVEIQELTITVSGSGTASITVNDTAYNVTLTAGTVQHNAEEIAASLTLQEPTYIFTANDDQVVASARFGAAAGTFAFTGSTATASWSQIVSGLAPTNDFIPQTSWNEDVRPDLDTSKLNVFRVKLEFLGAGAIEFYLEDSESGDFVLVHRIAYANTQEFPSVNNPSFKLGWISQNLTNNTAVQTSGASAGGFTEGTIVFTEESRSASGLIASLGTTQTNLITVRNRQVIDGKRNRVTTFMLSCSALTESAKGALLEVRKNATLGAGAVYEYIDKESSISEISDTSVSVSGGRFITSIPVSVSGATINLRELLTETIPGETLTFSMAQNGTPAATAQVTVTFVEDL